MKAYLQKLCNLNIVMLISMLGLIVLGVLFIYSACSAREDVSVQTLYMKHLEVAAVGLLIYLTLAVIDYRIIFKFSTVLYIGTLILLGAVLIPGIGTEIMGARRWLFGVFQPSEIAKLAVVMLLAWGLAKFSNERGFLAFIAVLCLTGIPAILILIQPDLGTTMVLAPTVFAMLFASRVAPKWLWGCFLLSLVIVSYLVLIIIYIENKNLPDNEKIDYLEKLTMLEPHQIKRLQTFIYPNKDLHGSGYNRHQSEIAVGSGGTWGKGYLQGEQYMLGYLPASVSANDFIFAVLAEEAGFAGTLLVLLLYFGLFSSCIYVALRCQNEEGRLFCIGIVTLLFSHAYINIAMTVGLMPITGLPLPFISYGRTFVATMMIALGLVQSVSIHGREPETQF